MLQTAFCSILNSKYFVHTCNKNNECSILNSKYFMYTSNKNNVCSILNSKKLMKSGQKQPCLFHFKIKINGSYCKNYNYNEISLILIFYFMIIYSHTSHNAGHAIFAALMKCEFKNYNQKNILNFVF